MRAAWLETHERTAIFAILLTALGLRLYLASFAGLPHLTSDSQTYIEMGDAILDGKPMSFFPNGFPLLLAAIAHMTGDADPQPAWLVMNALMSTGIVAAVYLTARRWVEPVLALTAAGIIAVWPTQLYFTSQLLSDIPSTFFLTFGTYLALRRRPVSAGLLLGIATLVRDSLLPAVLLLAAAGMADRDRRRDMATLLIAIAVAQAFDWSLQMLGVTLPPSHVGLNLLLAITSMSTDVMPSAPPGVTPDQIAHPWATYLGFAFEHPATFLAQRLASLYELWGPWPNAGGAGAPRGTLARAIIGLRFPLLLVALCGLWIGRRRAETWMVAAPLVTVTALHIAFFSSSPRFTIPMEPGAFVLGAFAVQGLVTGARKSARPPAPPTRPSSPPPPPPPSPPGGRVSSPPRASSSRPRPRLRKVGRSPIAVRLPAGEWVHAAIRATAEGGSGPFSTAAAACSS